MWRRKKVAEIWIKSQMGKGAAMSQYSLTNKEQNKASFFFFIFYWKQKHNETAVPVTLAPNKNNQNKKTTQKIRNISCIKKFSCEYFVPLHIIISNTYLYIHKHLKNRKQEWKYQNKRRQQLASNIK